MDILICLLMFLFNNQPILGLVDVTNLAESLQDQRAEEQFPAEYILEVGQERTWMCLGAAGVKGRAESFVFQG